MRNRHLISCLLIGASALGFAAPAAAQRVDRIIAFGDSYADDGNAIELLLASPFVPQEDKDLLELLYPFGRFSGGGTNYVDSRHNAIQNRLQRWRRWQFTSIVLLSHS